jgi:hypothetical protein
VIWNPFAVKYLESIVVISSLSSITSIFIIKKSRCPIYEIFCLSHPSQKIISRQSKGLVVFRDSSIPVKDHGARMVLAELVIRNVTATIVTAAIPAITTIAHFRIFIWLFGLFQT